MGAFDGQPSRSEENEMSTMATRADEYDRTIEASPFDKVAYLFDERPADSK